MSDDLESRVTELAAIVDGSEAFTREAVVHLIGLRSSYASTQFLGVTPKITCQSVRDNEDVFIENR